MTKYCVERFQKFPTREKGVKLTIGPPVFNGERYLADSIKCILEQTFGEFTLIICDNASTDLTPEICQHYAQGDDRIQVFRNPVNMGAVWNFNRALDLSRTPLFKWVAHDDLYHPEYLSTCLRLLEDNPDVVLAHSATAFIDESEEIFPFDPITQTYVDPIVKAQQTPDSPEIGLSQRPAERFRDVLSRARWGSHIFGVIRRDALLRARRLSNFSSCDRAMLAELALLGRFEATRQRLYLKRFHGGGSWALNQKQLKTYLGPHEQYSRRRRQLQAFFSAPLNKPISAMEKLAYVAIVAAHSAKSMVHIVGGRDARIAAQGKMWRRKNKDVGRRRDDCIANHEGSIK